ncbi:MAG: efflux RND transporter permease subunit [Syntrophomonadaceae bacterium]|nr:efflux RND transporter permease subunit [Syntrophomonadaceae bacterium]
MFLTNLSLKRPVLATVTIIALVVLGFYSYFQLDINDWPEVEFPYVTVTIVQPGASPEQMESKVAIKVEEAIGQIAGVKHINAQIHESVAIIWAEFTLETEGQTAAQNVRDKLASIRHELPQDIEEPVISRFDPTSAPIMSLAVTGEQSVQDMSKLVDDIIKQRLEAVPGVGMVEVVGDEQREIHIDMDAEKLSAYYVSPAEVAAALQQENLEVPAGDLKSESRKVPVRTSGEVKHWEDFKNLAVAVRDGVLLKIGDVATVNDSIKDPKNRAFFQGQPAIGLNIIKQSGNNTVRIADELKTAIAELNQQLPEGVKINVVRDNSVRVRASVNNVLGTLFEGTILALLTVFLFLRNWRSTLIGALAIPTSIITTFLMIKTMNFSLNTMSLIALSLSIGLLIDDAVVVIENIVRHMHMGKNPLAAARDATSEIGLAVMATTFTVVAVFLPVALMTGLAGQFLKQFGLTVVFSLLISLLVAFTLVPLLSSRYLRSDEENYRGITGWVLNNFNRGFEWFKVQYAHLLDIALLHRWKTLGVAAALFILSLAIVPFMGSSFVPNSDFGELSVVLDLDAGLTLDAAAQTATQADDIIKQHPEVISTFVTASPSEARIFVQLTNKNKRKASIEDIAAELREELRTQPGYKASMLFYNIIAEQHAWEYCIQGNDLPVLADYAEKVQRLLENTPGAVDISNSYRPGTPEMQLQIDPERAADLGISAGYVGDTIYTLLTGKVATQYRDKEDRIDVRLQLKDTQRQKWEDLNRISLPTPAGNVALDQVTRQVISSSPGVIERSDRAREITLSGNLRGISLGSFNKQFEQQLAAELDLPAGYRVYAGGDSQEMGETFNLLGLALILGILFIFLILAAQFESYIDPFAIMFSLPLAIVGAILGLFLMGSDISLVSMIGIIMLMGLVTKNAILLIDFIKQARARGVERNEAVRVAAATRLRPIMMTSTAMILGMVPVALSLGADTEWRAPMAHATIGGLITSTLLTLVVVPVIYTLLDDFTQWRKNKKSQPRSQQKVPFVG